MTKQELLDLGLTDEQAAGVLKLNGLAIEGLKQTNTQLQAELETEKKQGQTYQAQLKALGDEKPEDLKAHIEKLTQANETAAEEHQKALKELKITAAIDRALIGKVHDTDLVGKVLNREKLVFGDDEKLIGLEDQLADLRTNKPFLFVPDQTQGGFKVGLPPAGSGPDSVDKAISAAFGNVSNE